MGDSDQLPAPADGGERETPTATGRGTGAADGGSDGDTLPTVVEGTIRRPEEMVLERGARVGRYLVLSPLGKGGMGVVYEAYDPKLDRRIALKILRASAGDDRVNARDRLLREAQALAQLTHPNVIAVYDAGTIHDNVFIAIELVEGVNMRQWLKAKGRPRAEILRVMLAAGRGLAAAHEAGLVHRDVKPENILVGDDGRVLIVDFGLARPPRNAASTPAAGEAPPSVTEEDRSIEQVLGTGDHLLDSPVTALGAIVGTPGYIAPEVYRGEEFDELSDQFSFCVTLYQVLVGQRPYSAGDARALRAKVIAGDVIPIPKQARLRARHRRLIARGMALLPRDRFPSMNALLAELGRDRRGLAVRIALGSTIAVLGATAVTLAATRSHGEANQCATDPRAFAAAWDAEARAATSNAFDAADPRHGADTFGRISKLIDDRVQRWNAMQREECRATHVRKVQSPQLLDLKMSCLDRRRAELIATLELFRTQADLEVVTTAVTSLHELPRLESCSDTEALLAAVPPPATAAARERARAIRGQLDAALALQHAGKYDAGRSIAGAALEQARELGYDPLTAEAAQRLGWLQASAGDFDAGETTLKEAASLAATARDGRRLAEIGVTLLDVVGNKKRKYDEALAMSDLVGGLIAVLGNPPELRADFLVDRGFLFGQTDQRALAVAALEEAALMTERLFGENDIRVGHVLNQLGYVRVQDKDYVSANVHLTRALRIWEAALGPEHPKVAIALNNLGEVQSSLGDHDAALASFERARDLYAGSLGDDHPKVAIALTNQANQRALRGECQMSLPDLDRALEIWAAKLPPDHPYHAYALTIRGRCLVELGRPVEALAGLERALEIRSAKGSASSRSLTGFALARALWDSNRDRRRAIELARLAREVFTDDPSAADELQQVTAWLEARARRR